ncbi:AraC family transcriptional regulator [Methylobacterium trifolii]|uniref:HTH-type transcriptional regulator VirS n=1 Tax=Methylobacterium trifolii TaxID=1003092 RepID=A0ABQ4U481_9HYPH|nr:AraC family transcriptional regulator [Methylobacterium trifolii]GJE61952.1 HTH-type transcriptional regulator VirS [Methylobacterium trifolii]
MVAHIQARPLMPLPGETPFEVPVIGLGIAGRAKGIPSDRHDARVGTLRELPSVLRALGFEPDPIIGRYGLDPRLLDDGDNMLPASSVSGLLETCMEETGCRHLGLLVGDRAKASCFGVVGLLMQHQATVSESLRCLIEHGHLYDRGAVSTLEATNGTATLHYGFSPADAEGGRQIVDGALASGFRLMQALCGPEWEPREVLLSHPSGGDEAAYRRIFGVPVRFDQEGTALVFEARWLSHPVVGADPGFRHILELQVRALEHLHDEALSSQLRRSLRTLLLRKGCSAGRTAQLFAMHRRTMSRRLKAEGHSFQHLVDEVRYDIAHHLLTNASMPLAEVSVALGYSEASAFTRAFRRWSGINPKTWRVGTSMRHSLPAPAIAAALPVA